jgi:hypothetical protein
MRALAPEVRFFIPPQPLENGRKNRTSVAKAVYIRLIYGTAKPVPFVRD